MGRYDAAIAGVAGGRTGWFALPEVRAMAPEVPRAIVVARVLTIFFMMYVHAWTGSPAGDSAAMADMARPAADLLANVIGRSAVPLLTIVSGYLLVTSSFRHKSWRQVVADKCRSLLLPMWLWNAAFVALILLAGYAHGAANGLSYLSANGPSYLSANGLSYLSANGPSYLSANGPMDWIFALSAPPAVLPLAFLRDLFLIILASPLLIAGMQRWPHALLVAAAAFTILDPDQAILLRPQLLLFFLVGVGFALHWTLPTRVPALAVVALLAVAVTQSLWLPALVGQAGAYGHPVELALRNLLRFDVALLCWLACLWLQNSHLHALFARTEPVIFLAFCSHFILFRAIGQLLPADTPILFPLFLLQPALAIVAAFALRAILRQWAPGLLAVLNGGRRALVRG